jgi:hypothetical protein
MRSISEVLNGKSAACRIPLIPNDAIGQKDIDRTNRTWKIQQEPQEFGTWISWLKAKHCFLVA